MSLYPCQGLVASQPNPPQRLKIRPVAKSRYAELPVEFRRGDLGRALISQPRQANRSPFARISGQQPATGMHLPREGVGLASAVDLVFARVGLVDQVQQRHFLGV